MYVCTLHPIQADDSLPEVLDPDNTCAPSRAHKQLSPGAGGKDNNLVSAGLVTYRLNTTMGGRMVQTYKRFDCSTSQKMECQQGQEDVLGEDIDTILSILSILYYFLYRCLSYQSHTKNQPRAPPQFRPRPLLLLSLSLSPGRKKRKKEDRLQRRDTMESTVSHRVHGYGL